MALANTFVIPHDWVEHHRPIVEATLGLPARLVRQLDGPPEPGTDVTDTVVWEGRIRLQRLSQARTTPVSDAVEQTRQYLAVLPADVLDKVRVGDYGDTLITEHGDTYRVVDVMRGSLLWETDLIVTETIPRGGEA